MVDFAVGRKVVVESYKAGGIPDRFNARTGKIIENDYESRFIIVRLDDDGFVVWFTEDELKLVTETPQPSFVKFIPEQVIPARREIVETVVKIGGVDAILLSKHHETDMPCGASEIGIQINMIFTADDLREASNVFLELASILEENAK